MWYFHSNFLSSFASTTLPRTRKYFGVPYSQPRPILALCTYIPRNWNEVSWLQHSLVNFLSIENPLSSPYKPNENASLWPHRLYRIFEGGNKIHLSSKEVIKCIYLPLCLSSFECTLVQTWLTSFNSKENNVFTLENKYYVLNR